MPDPILADFSADWHEAGIHLLPLAMEMAGTNRVVPLWRVSGRRQVKEGLLDRQGRIMDVMIEEAGGEIIAPIGTFKHQSGRLTGIRHDLRDAWMLAKADDPPAIICARDWTRFFRSEDFDFWKNRLAEPTRNDLQRLRKMIPRSIPLAVLVSPALPMQELHKTIAKWGREQSQADGNKMGRRPTALAHLSTAQIEQMIALRREGMACADLARLPWIGRGTQAEKQAVVRFFKTHLEGAKGPSADS